MSKKIPRSNDNDYSLDIVQQRQAFIEENTAAKLDHTKRFSFSPDDMSGNIENLFGVAQVPIGLAGPLLVNGEHAQGGFYVPMATIVTPISHSEIPARRASVDAASTRKCPLTTIVVNEESRSTVIAAL